MGCCQPFYIGSESNNFSDPLLAFFVQSLQKDGLRDNQIAGGNGESIWKFRHKKYMYYL